MTQPEHRGLALVQQQINELDALAKQTLADLNTVAGTERVTKWKARTVAVLTDALGAQMIRKFAVLQPGPSFTNDLVEEFTDLIESYRTPLVALAKQLAQAPRLRQAGDLWVRSILPPPSNDSDRIFSSIPTSSGRSSRWPKWGRATTCWRSVRVAARSPICCAKPPVE